MVSAALVRTVVGGYLLGVAVEAPLLVAGLSRRHSLRRRAAAGVWLTGCTYPIVALVLPTLFAPTGSGLAYLVGAETFAPLAECGLFTLAFGRGEGGRGPFVRDLLAIVVANLASFAVGVALSKAGLW
jgi:hypothetical protein